MQTNRSNTGALVGGTLLVLFGLLSLAGQIFRGLNWSLLWPFSVIILGALFFAGMFLGGKNTSGLAIPGSIIGGIGLVLLFENITGHWESMAYIWTLIILFVGVGIYLTGLYAGNTEQKSSGMRVMKIGLVLFIIFGAFFEMIFSSFNNLVFPALLILLGAYLIITRSGLLGGKKSESTEPNPPTNQ